MNKEINSTTEVVVTVMSATEVDEATFRLGLLRDGIETQLAKYADIVSDLYQRRAWIAKGSDSWDAFVIDMDIVVYVSRDERQQIGAALRTAGMPTRAIAATQGVSHKTISTDLAQVLPRGNSGPVVGVDGRSYSAPAQVERPRRRRPLPDGVRDAVWELNKIVEKLERFVADDRYHANRTTIAELVSGQISNIESRLFALSEELNEAAHPTDTIGRPS